MLTKFIHKEMVRISECCTDFHFASYERQIAKIVNDSIRERSSKEGSNISSNNDRDKGIYCIPSYKSQCIIIIIIFFSINIIKYYIIPITPIRHTFPVHFTSLYILTFTTVTLPLYRRLHNHSYRWQKSRLSANSSLAEAENAMSGHMLTCDTDKSRLVFAYVL